MGFGASGCRLALGRGARGGEAGVPGITLSRSDDVVKTEGSKSTTSIQLPAAVKNWVGDGLPDQVKDTYNEIAGKKPAGDLPH